jgi:hypothetical protein
MAVHHSIANLAFSWFSEPQSHYVVFCAIEADFNFWINTEPVLQVSHWNIGELAAQLAQWLRTGLLGDFHYECMDADEQDLFTFGHHETGFLFFSEWGTDTATRFVTREALTAFIKQYMDEVRNQIMNDLGFDASLYLSH